MAGPASFLKKSRGFRGRPEPQDDPIARQDRAEATENQGPEPKPMDRSTALLDDPVFVTDYTWPFMCVAAPGGGTRQLCVTRFYLRKQFALDMFRDEVPPKADMERKAALLKEHGIRYFCLHNGNSLADLAAYIGGA